MSSHELEARFSYRFKTWRRIPARRGLERGGRLAAQNLVWKVPAANRPNDGANIRRITSLHGAAHSYALQDESDNTGIGRRVNANVTSMRKYHTSPRFVPLSYGARL